MNKLRRKITLSAIFLISTAVICVLSSLLVYFTKADLAIFSYTLSGVVSDQSSNSIPDAEITLNGELVATADKQGYYKISGLSEGRYEFIVKKEGYVDRNVTVDINRTFFKYNFARNITLSNAANAGVKGRFIVEDTAYQFLDDRIIINNGSSYSIEKDGTFDLQKIPSGEINFHYSSMDYKDINENITLNPDDNTLADITLEPAGDIEETLKSYVLENDIENVVVTGEGVEQDNIEILDNQLKIKDLEPGRNYKIRVTAEGYEPREYDITIQQGINKLPNFRLVEEGQAVFNFKQDKDYLFYKADFDGSDLTQLTNNEVDQKSFYFNSNEDALYIASEQDRASGFLGGRIPLIYLFDLNTNVYQKLTNNTEGLSILFPQYRSQKIVNITSDDRRSNKRIVEIRDFQGNITKPVETTFSTNYLNAELSSDSKYLATLVQNADESISLSYFNLETNKKTNILTNGNIKLHAISESGKRVVFSANRSSNNFTDLLLFDRDTNEIRTLIVDEQGGDYQFYAGSDDLILYWDTIQDQTDVFMYNIENNKTSQLTKLSALDKIEKIYQQGHYLFYITNRGLYIMDIQNPKSNKLVLNGEFTY
ncbi:carboxypeptidase regulatory-like domain-containing protein [Candidatus Dojkabacteria bacterium]|uniref:Carboxypeptidase regulatory-like domain-containing protein n=1 Tax=Candidatus Dojkabacteria bacterium TaxID=2099670 RepID=A0A955L296_9BACT|nr:carboxypeptidase regulatory-like domain-containing protein [Candidatus Dojkabacteria bacterium]